MENKISNEKPQITLKVELKPYLLVYSDGSGARSNSKRWVAERIPTNGDIFECCGCIFKIAMKDNIPYGHGNRYNNYTVEGYIISADGVTLPEVKAGMDFMITLNVLATSDEDLKVINETVVNETGSEDIDPEEEIDNDN